MELEVYQSFIGLEIHIQLSTKTKVFCGCRAAFGDEPNTNVCPVCLGYPGVLPALNERAIHMAYVVARALNCTLNPVAAFDRKNYFYPDLPKNYQISQFAEPVGVNGYLDLEFHRKKKRVRIHECHLEEDAGKMIHAGDMSLLDYNRAGTPLLEIVTEPDLEIGDEAELLLQQFRRMVRYLGVCDGNMEEGSLRCDANVSVNLAGQGLGRKVEIKNLNSSRFVRKALSYEITRQTGILENGGTVVQETRLWNENRDVTESMRSKESAHDYRYFPEPDLPQFRADEAFLAGVEQSLVELPAARRDRFMSQYALSEAQADFMCDEKPTADYFEETVGLGAEAGVVAVWLSGDVKKMLNRDSVQLADCRLTPARLASLLIMLGKGRIHGKIAKQTLEAIFEEDKDPEAIIREKGWEQITDQAALSELVDGVLAKHEQAVAAIRAGDSKPLGFLVGQVMKLTAGRAEPQLVQEMLKAKLSLNVVQVLSFGGAISGRRRADGLVEPGDLMDVRKLFSEDDELPDGIRFEEIQLGRFLSEEITPADWAALIDTVKDCLEAGNASGIVVAHGTDTLAYTASLLYWVFGDTRTPIVLTAASTPSSRTSDTGSFADDEAVRNLKHAIRVATDARPGVYVVYGDEEFSPINLKFQRAIAPGSGTDGHVSQVSAGTFRNWNLARPVHSGHPVTGGHLPSDRRELQQRLEHAIKSVFIARIYPGMQGSSLISLIQSGIKYFILELFDTGTASLRETPYSLRHAFDFAKGTPVRFFCTSQQEGTVDFSEYVTGHELWREGAVPMGTLTTESVYTRLIAALVAAETDDELMQLMEEH